MKKRGKKDSAADEGDLWHRVVGTARPLPERLRNTGKGKLPSAPPAKAEAPPKGEKRRIAKPPGQIAKPEPPPKAPPSIMRLEARAARRLARGQTSVDARIDLHGMRRSEAQSALLAFLRNAQANDKRMVLVITGKGQSAGSAAGFGAPERGVLRQEVPRWLALPQFRELVVSFAPAHRRHGGEGALYLQLRRPRP